VRDQRVNGPADALSWPPGFPRAFRESVGYAEQNLYARAAQLVGDKDPRQHEYTVQFRAFDASKSGAKVGVALLVSLRTALLKKPTRGGLIIVGEIHLGGSIEPIHNATTVAEIAVEKGASALPMPVACRRQLFDLSDDMAAKVDNQFYSDARDALLKAIQRTGPVRPSTGRLRSIRCSPPDGHTRRTIARSRAQRGRTVPEFPRCRAGRMEPCSSRMP